ncbi:hypothetical protein [uncultured Duncaniella sp.]|uniref:hypothetical protein n=1 Tax=uncultured Duncaniella sp. TaxID=2768039 RepID=UPI00267593EE|nr:hypothetical protein [uncultured Duncaniella sp.]MCI9173292.1 hypothetical protein [Muribaculaceae bacterium]
MPKNCSSIQKSLGWCQGTPEAPGVKKRVYYISTNQIVGWPQLERDENGRPISAAYKGDFTLAEDAVWHYIDHLPNKAEVKSETQGEVPSQTIKNTISIVHPAVGAEAAAASCYLLNTDNVFLVEDMKGNIRVIGSPYYDAIATVAQDLGQGSTGTTGTTITLEASDIVSLPVYSGKIVTEDGTINDTAEP